MQPHVLVIKIATEHRARNGGVSTLARAVMRTPQALQSVRGPFGPQRHCGVWCVLQYWQRMRRGLRGLSPAGSGGIPRQNKINQNSVISFDNKQHRIPVTAAQT